MCKCTPQIRTPYCGKGDCVWPHEKEGVRSDRAEELKPEDCPEAIYLDSVGTGTWTDKEDGAWQLKYVRADLCTRPPDAGCVVPEGWKLVPVEPTEEIYNALHAELSGDPDGFSFVEGEWYTKVYKAVLKAAAPQSAQKERE